jgi:hypothetical protein
MARLTQVASALVRWSLGACALCLILLALYVSLGRQLLPAGGDLGRPGTDHRCP